MEARRSGLGAECARLRGQWADMRKAACEAAGALLEALPVGALQAELLPGASRRRPQTLCGRDSRMVSHCMRLEPGVALPGLGVCLACMLDLSYSQVPLIMGRSLGVQHGHQVTCTGADKAALL